MFVDPSGRGKDETSYAVLKLSHGGMFLVACGGFLAGYDDKTLNAFVAIAKKHEVKLILCEPNYGGGRFTKLLISAVQQYPYDCRVENADWSAVAEETPDRRRAQIGHEPASSHSMSVGDRAPARPKARGKGPPGADEEAHGHVSYRHDLTARPSGGRLTRPRACPPSHAVKYWPRQRPAQPCQGLTNPVHCRW
jgi:hypothetical protein